MIRAFATATFFALLPPGADAAQIFRCTSGSESIYQGEPCAASFEQRALPTADFPEVNTAERERLLRREAALEARLLKRAEIEAAERIARDERKARELELQAERQRVPAAADATPVYVIPLLSRPYRSRHRPAPPIHY